MTCTNQSFSGFSYDPEGTSITTDKKINDQKKRVIGFSSPDIWVSNKFAGARANEVYYEAPNIVIEIEPERSPMLNSPWYAFKLWGNNIGDNPILLRYKGGTHRYTPKISTDRKQWHALSGTASITDSSTYLFEPAIPAGADTVWVAGQEIITSTDRQRWLHKLSESDNRINISSAGKTVRGRTIPHVVVSDTALNHPGKGVLILLSRQHPPEIPGDLAMEAFVESILEAAPLAHQFLKRFDVHLFPMVNPDGVDLGHWRTNANGVDLNRDWQAFNQPETQAIQQTLCRLQKNKQLRVYYHIDFHATNEHVLYPILPEIEKFTGNITQPWLERIKTEVPAYPFRAEAFDTTAPIAKNWLFKTFGADGVTFEIYDETDREVVTKLGHTSSRLLMELLIDAFEAQATRSGDLK